MHSFRFSSSCAARSSFACCSSRVAAASSFIFCSRELTISAVLALTRATSSSFAFGVRGAASPASSRSIASSSSSTSSSGSSIPSVLAGLSSSTPSAAAPLGLSTWPTWREASSCPPLPDDTPKLSTTSIEAVLEPSERWNSVAFMSKMTSSLSAKERSISMCWMRSFLISSSSCFVRRRAVAASAWLSSTFSRDSRSSPRSLASRSSEAS
mmetsp:Transcript_17197/g.65648  ORF Transcript_17197/g.65648 Transcript_17197/m.65648 type:complete len:211 (+) Transcript_17197:750-1382(+)